MLSLFHFPDPAEFTLFTLVLGRMGGLFSAIPLFGGKGVPARIKITIVFTMTLIFFPVVRAHLTRVPTDVLSLGLLVSREVLIGLSLGLLSQVIFSAVEFCGQFIGMQMGFTTASMFDPTMGTQTAVLSVLENLLATLLFMTLGMHHLFLNAIIESYRVVPLGAWHVNGALLAFVVSTTGGIFTLAIKLAAPLMASLLAATVSLGVMARIFPQMNIFMMSFPLNIGLGFIVLGITAKVFFHTLSNSFANLSQQMSILFRLLGA